MSLVVEGYYSKDLTIENLIAIQMYRLGDWSALHPYLSLAVVIFVSLMMIYRSMSQFYKWASSFCETKPSFEERGSQTLLSEDLLIQTIRNWVVSWGLRGAGSKEQLIERGNDHIERMC